MRDTEQTLKDKIRRWVLENAESQPGFRARQVFDNVGVEMSIICNVLREMVEEEILERRRVCRTYEYYPLHMHDVEEYLLDKKAQLFISKQYSSYISANNRLKRRVERLEEAVRNKELHVSCECGRRFIVEIKLEEIPLYDSS